MTTPQIQFHGYPKRPVPDILGGSDWDVPMVDRDSDSIFLLVEYLKITDPENANEPTAYKMVSQLNQEHTELERKAIDVLRSTPGIQEDKDQSLYRIMFQFLQYQVGQLVIKALEATGGDATRLVGMMRWHNPGIAPAETNDAVMKTTVEEALKTLGKDHSPQAVEELWRQLNQQVDLLSWTRRAQRLAGWAEDVQSLPGSSEEMKRIFLQDQNEAAWTVIDQHLTEPINALMEQQEEEDPWAVDWDS